MVVFIESHLNIKANKFRQVPVRVAVLSAENFKLEYKTLTHDQDNIIGKENEEHIERFGVLLSYPNQWWRLCQSQHKVPSACTAGGTGQGMPFLEVVREKMTLIKKMGRKLKEWQNFLDQMFLRL